MLPASPWEAAPRNLLPMALYGRDLFHNGQELYSELFRRKRPSSVVTFQETVKLFVVELSRQLAVRCELGPGGPALRCAVAGQNEVKKGGVEWRLVEAEMTHSRWDHVIVARVAAEPDAIDLDRHGTTYDHAEDPEVEDAMGVARDVADQPQIDYMGRPRDD